MIWLCKSALDLQLPLLSDKSKINLEKLCLILVRQHLAADIEVIEPPAIYSEKECLLSLPAP